MIVIGYLLRWGAIALFLITLFNYNSYLNNILFIVPVGIFLLFCVLYGGFIIQREKAIKALKKIGEKDEQKRR